jgi:hypothetical protein
MMVLHTTMVNLEVRLPQKKQCKPKYGNKGQNKQKCDQDKWGSHDNKEKS